MNVRDNKPNIGMIVYRKGNYDIGVSFGHYHLSLTTHPDLTTTERAKYLRNFGVDEMFISDQLRIK